MFLVREGGWVWISIRATPTRLSETATTTAMSSSRVVDVEGRDERCPEDAFQEGEEEEQGERET